MEASLGSVRCALNIFREMCIECTQLIFKAFSMTKYANVRGLARGLQVLQALNAMENGRATSQSSSLAARPFTRIRSERWTRWGDE